MTEKVDIVRSKNGFAVERENTGRALKEFGTQAEAIQWTINKGYEYNIHRVRNREDGNKHGQFRKK